ncbi:mannitol dehydrogenase family protein, partial [Kineococcus glutinatus]|uniref:mannitol dehydrogenase family protein n=1 Tax=Kineococcus glutinatus TaxID=1070872 RepID=UPI0031EC8AC2
MSTPAQPLRPSPAAQPVRADTLQALPAGVGRPGYDRAALVPSVVHIGVGGFHRAHQEVYFDALARLGETGWGVVGVGLHHPQMGEALHAQDTLYTVVVRGADGDEVRVIGSMVDYLYAPSDPGRVLAALADERTRLVTLTITGAAYPDGDVDPGDERVRADVERPEAPATAFGYLVEALRRRRREGLAGFTVLSCDNLPRNGRATRAAVLGTARLRDPDLARWIARSTSFPCSAADRITPLTTPRVREEIVRAHGLADRWPVVTEPFSQWIVEDDFRAGRPPLERVGVRFVTDVGPHALAKTRLLNGAHCAMGHLALLAGIATTDGAMAEPVLRRYVEGYLAEAAAVLPDVPGTDLREYRAALLRRLANPRLGDGVPRLCRRGSSKVPEHVLPSLRAALERDLPRGHLVLAVAAWLRCLRGTDHAGARLDVDDDGAALLRPLAAAAG